MGSQGFLKFGGAFAPRLLQPGPREPLNLNKRNGEPDSSMRALPLSRTISGLLMEESAARAYTNSYRAEDRSTLESEPSAVPVPGCARERQLPCDPLVLW